MMAPTHVTFGVLVVSLLGAVLGAPISPTAFAFAILGSLLPDVDTTTSAIGKLSYPLAWYLERHYGHRGATHSLAGLVFVAMVASPILFAPWTSDLGLRTSAWLCLLAGYFSHLLADSMNKQGIPLFWPNTTYRAVLPGNESYRIKVQSTAELVLFLVLLPLTAMAVPLSQLSLTTALHYIIRNVNSAVSDYQAWAGQYLVWVEIEGRHNLSQKPVQGLFEAIGTAGQNAIVIRDGQGDIYAAGNSREDQIYVHRIRAIRGIPIRTEIQEVRLADQLLGDLFTHFEQRSGGAEEQGSLSPLHPSASAPLRIWIEGWFVTPSQPVLIDDVGEFNRSRQAQGVAGESLFEIRYFTPEDLAPLQDIYVTRAHFILRTVYPVQGSGGAEVQR